MLDAGSVMAQFIDNGDIQLGNNNELLLIQHKSSWNRNNFSFLYFRCFWTARILEILSVMERYSITNKMEELILMMQVLIG
jgi:hypothetical protein